jgi:uroporphyrinogen-III synthase
MIINTRPLILADKTNQLLKGSGLDFLHNPLTKISSISPSDEDLLKLRQLDSYDVIIFTSQSAAKFGASFLKEHIKDNLEIPIMAIGLATQAALNDHDLISNVPSAFNSVSLAELIEQGKHEKCLIFCGGKQPQLSFHTPVTLDTFSCYEVIDEESVELSSITGNRKAIFLIYNIQTLEVLVRYSRVADLEKMNLIVASPRIQEAAFNHGIKDCVVAESPHDEEMTEAAIKLARS